MLSEAIRAQMGNKTVAVLVQNEYAIGSHCAMHCRLRNGTSSVSRSKLKWVTRQWQCLCGTSRLSRTALNVPAGQRLHTSMHTQTLVRDKAVFLSAVLKN